MESVKALEGSVLEGGDNVALEKEVLEVGEPRESSRTQDADVVVAEVAERRKDRCINPTEKVREKSRVRFSFIIKEEVQRQNRNGSSSL